MHPGPRWLPTERRLHELPHVKENFELQIQAMDRAGVDMAVCLLMDEDWFRTEAGNKLFEIYRTYDWDQRFVFCAMFDIFRIFETEKALDDVAAAAKLGVRGIKIHPDIQRVNKRDFPRLAALAQKAEELNMFLIVHAYSNQHMEYDNIGLEIVSSIASLVKTPIIVAHAGGVDFSRAVFLAKHHENIMLDLSYILELEPLNFKIGGLLKWGIDQLGAGRFLFGSDHPSCDTLQYINRYMEIFQEIRLTSEEISMIFGENALKIINEAGEI
ncbi:amidohydrolase family protein [Paenibacillus sp. FSL H8-0034]|uniref:amidohydrolase family protein n=1 Tax=Paenibacillus sp. FSL H8-0034 TaxID=2954671 RepID=UPI0030FCE4A0